MKKILYLATQSEFGGAQRYVLDLATSLARKGDQVEVAAGGNEELFKQLKIAGIKGYRLKNLVRSINPAKDLAAYFEIKKLIKSVQPDIIHLNSTKAGVIGAIAAKHAGVKKIIYTVHGFVFNEPLPIWKKTFYRWAEKLSAKYKDKIICVSEFDRQSALKSKIAPAERLVTIHNGIPPLTFGSQQQLRQELKLPTDKVIIGTIARFYPTKGLSYFIKAAAIIKKQIPNLLFTIINDGRDRKELETEIEKHDLKKEFVLLEIQNNAWQYLPALNVYVCSSIKEGFPYSILEAMAANLPIVSTNVGGIPEMIDDKKTGLLVRPKDTASLAKAILELLQNKNLAGQLGRQAKIAAEQKFSSDKMISQTETVYQTS